MFVYFVQIISDACQVVGSDISNSTVKSQSERAVKLAYHMFKCVPPLVVCQPVEYTPEWHEIMPAHWPDNLDGPYDLIYYQPVLLFTPYGPVAEKGQVGRILRQQSSINIAGELKDKVNPAYKASYTSTESSSNQGSHVYEHIGELNEIIVAITEINPYQHADGNPNPSSHIDSECTQL